MYTLLIVRTFLLYLKLIIVTQSLLRKITFTFKNPLASSINLSAITFKISITVSQIFKNILVQRMYHVD